MNNLDEMFDSFVVNGEMLDAVRILELHGDSLDVNKSGAFLRAVTNRDYVLVALMFFKYSNTLEYPDERIREVLEVISESAKIVNTLRGSRLLINSLLFGWQTIPELLVKYGVNVNVQEDGTMPLGAAIFGGNVRNVKLLLDYGARMYCVDAERTAFDAAIIYNRYDALVELIKRGGDINKQNRRGRTPLMVAAEHRRYDMTVLLLANGADVNVRCDDFTTALIAGGDLNIMRLLVDVGAEFTKPEYGETALISACRKHLWKGPTTLEVVQNLFSLGFDRINDEDSFGCTALMIASWTDPALVQLLLEKGAEVHHTCGWEGSALHFAVRHDDISFSARKVIIELLLDHGADIHGRDQNGNTPLLLASKNLLDASAVKLLLSKGACANDRDHKGLFPLMFAVAKSDEQMVSVLLDYGANMFRRTIRGTTVMKKISSDFVQSDIKQQLVKHESTILRWELFSLST